MQGQHSFQLNAFLQFDLCDKRFFQNLSFWLSHHCHHHWRCHHDLILEVDKPQKSDSYHKLDEGSVFLLVVRCEKRRSSGKRSSTELIPERYDAESYLDVAGRREMLSQCLS